MTDTPRFAIRFTTDGAFEFYTDADALTVLSIDDNEPASRIYEWQNLVHRLTPGEFDRLVGNDPIHRLGDEPAAEQAVRAMLNRAPNGKPRLSLVKNDPCFDDGTSVEDYAQ